LTWDILVISGLSRKLSPILSQSRRDQSDTRGRTPSIKQISSRHPNHRNNHVLKWSGGCKQVIRSIKVPSNFEIGDE